MDLRLKIKRYPPLAEGEKFKDENHAETDNECRG
jgi:hypothetical protein